MEVNQAHPNARDGVEAFNINESVHASFIGRNSKLQSKYETNDHCEATLPKHYRPLSLDIPEHRQISAPFPSSVAKLQGSPWMLLY